MLELPTRDSRVESSKLSNNVVLSLSLWQETAFGAFSIACDRQPVSLPESGDPMIH